MYPCIFDLWTISVMAFPAQNLELDSVPFSKHDHTGGGTILLLRTKVSKKQLSTAPWNFGDENLIWHRNDPNFPGHLRAQTWTELLSVLVCQPSHETIENSYTGRAAKLQTCWINHEFLWNSCFPPPAPSPRGGLEKLKVQCHRGTARVLFWIEPRNHLLELGWHYL